MDEIKTVNFENYLIFLIAISKMA